MSKLNLGTKWSERSQHSSSLDIKEMRFNHWVLLINQPSLAS